MLLYVELTFVGVVAIIFGLYWLIIANPESQEQAALRKRLKGDKKGTVEARVTLTREEKPLSRIAPLDVALNQVEALNRPIQRLLSEADLDLSPGAFVLMTVASFLLGAVIAQRLVPAGWLVLLIGVVTGTIPTFVVRFMRTQRLKKFEEQFPEAVELIARALRAGHAFATGLKMAADEMPAPVGPEFRLLFDRQNYGASMNDALRAFAERIPIIDARFFATAVLTQREAGGNLAEVLDRLAAVMRERFKVKREIRTKSAHGRITAWVLAGLPPSVALALVFISPEQMQLLITDPLGQRMLMGAAVLQVLGTVVIRRLVDLRY
jgi:tight adherence protein B